MKIFQKGKREYISGLGILFVVVLLPLLLMTFIRMGSTFPSFPGVDHYHYHVWENKLLDEHGYNSLFLHSEAGPKYTLAQPISYYALLGQIDVFLNTKFLDFHYYAPFFTIIWFAVLLYFYAITFFKKRVIAILATIFGITIVGSGHFYGPHDFYGTSVTLLLSLTFILVFLRNMYKHIDKRFIWFSVLAYIVVFLMYPFTATMVFPLVMYLFIKRKNKSKYLTIIPVLVVVLLLLSFQASFLRSQIWNFTSQLKLRLNLIHVSYSYLHMSIILIGLILLFFKNVRKHINNINKSGVFFFVYSIIIFLIFWMCLPDGITIRLEWYFRLFLVMIGMLPFYIFINFLKNKSKSAIIFFIFFIMVVVFQYIPGFGLFNPTISYKNGQEYIGGAISAEEDKLINFIGKNTYKNDYIIGEPHFGSIIRGSIDRFSSSAIIRPSGQLPNPSSGTSIRELKNDNFAFISELINVSNKIWSNEGYAVSTTTKKNVDNNKTEITNLIDGKTDTLAYLGNTHNNYIITFSKEEKLSRIKITWGNFGLPYGEEKKEYINKWEIKGKVNGSWISIVKGDTPNSESTLVDISGKFGAIMILTEGKEWNGIYEVNIKKASKIINQEKMLNNINNSLIDLNLNRTINDFYILITPRTMYWVQENSINCKENKCLLTNKLPSWPIKTTEVPYQQTSIISVLENSDWKILYHNDGNIFAKYTNY